MNRWWRAPLTVLATVTVLPLVVFVWFMGSVHLLAGIEWEDEGDGDD